MVAGGALVAAALVGKAYGDWEEPKANCQVDVGFGRITAANECRFDQVMVGIQSNYILCADLSVSCPNERE